MKGILRQLTAEATVNLKAKDAAYRVVRLVNTVEWTVGLPITRSELQVAIEDGIKVTIVLQEEQA